MYYAFYTATNTVHPIFGPKIIFWCLHELLSRFYIEIPLLIPGDKIIAPLLSRAQEVKLVRPLKSGCR